MRVLAAALMMGTVLTAQTTAAPRTATSTKKSTTATKLHPTSPMKALPMDTNVTEGVAAVGTMPAATGTPADMFTLRFIDLKIGDGEEARPTLSRDKVVFYTVHYTGWTTDGNKFDSSVDRGAPIVFPIGVHGVIAGWDLGFQGMRVGGKRRLIIPWQLAYGVAGRPPIIPEKADLIFDVELVGQGATPDPVTGTHFESPAAATPPTAAPAAPAAETPEERHE